MYPPFHDDCSSEIVQHTIDYGTAVHSSFSKRSSRTPLSTYQNIVSYSIGHNCPSLVTKRSMCCQTSLVNIPDDVSLDLEVPSGEREVPPYNSKVCSRNPEVCSYNPEVPTYHPEVPPCTPDICSGDHKCDIDPEPVDDTSKRTMTLETSREIDMNYSSKMQIKHQKKRRLGRIRLPLKLSCFRHWNIIRKSAFRRLRPTPVESERMCVPACNIPKPILKEFGTGMKVSPPKTAAIVTSKWLKNLNSKVLHDVAGETSGLSVRKKAFPILVSAFTSNEDMLKSTSKIVLQTGTQISKSPFANHKGLMAKKRTVSFNGGSSDVTKLSSTNHMLKQDCSVMTETLGSGSIRPVLVSLTVGPRNSTPNLPVKFCPSKWADVVVNRIMQHGPLKRQKQLKTQSCETGTTPVKLISFSTQPRSFHSSINLTRHNLLTSTKSSQGHHNIANDLGTQNSRPDLPFCSSDLAEKVAKKIIQHMQMKSEVKSDTQERGINVDTDCYVMKQPEPDILSNTSERIRKSDSLKSGDSTKLNTVCSSVKDVPVMVCNVSNHENRSRVSENGSQHSTEHNNAGTELQLLKINSDCNASQPSKQESPAKPSENSQPSRDSSKLDSSATLKSKQDPEPKHENQSRCSSPPRGCDSKEDCKTSRDGIVLIAGTDPECDEDCNASQPSMLKSPAKPSENSQPSRDSSKLDSSASLKSKQDPEPKPEMILNRCSSPLRGCDSKENCKTSRDGIELITGKDPECDEDCNDTGEKITPMQECAALEPHDAQFLHNFCREIGVNVSISMCPLTTRSVDHKICQSSESRKLAGSCTCQASNCDCQCTKLVHVLGLNGSKTEMGDSNTLLTTKEIQVSLSKSDSTQLIEAVSDDSGCDFSIVQYIGNLWHKKMAQVKCRFNKREEPLQAFALCQAVFRAMQVRESSTEQSQRDIESQTSITEQVPVLTSTEVQKAIGEAPPDEAKAYKPRCKPQEIWHTKVCTIHRGRRYESGESRTAWCVRMRQSCLVNHAFSMTNICSGHEKEDLRGVYYMLSAIEGRIRRVKCGNRMIF